MGGTNTSAKETKQHTSPTPAEASWISPESDLSPEEYVNQQHNMQPWEGAASAAEEAARVEAGWNPAFANPAYQSYSPGAGGFNPYTAYMGGQKAALSYDPATQAALREHRKASVLAGRNKFLTDLQAKRAEQQAAQSGGGGGGGGGSSNNSYDNEAFFASANQGSNWDDDGNNTGGISHESDSSWANTSSETDAGGIGIGSGSAAAGGWGGTGIGGSGGSGSLVTGGATSGTGWTPPGFDWNDGTMGVPDMFGRDPLMLTEGSPWVPPKLFKVSQNEMVDQGKQAFKEAMMEMDPSQSMTGQIRGAAMKAVMTPMMDPMMGIFMNDGGYAGWQHYAMGEDSVPAMLTPGEAVIPAPAAQDPANRGAIQGMIQQGRAMNDGMPAPSPMEGGADMEVTAVGGPLSGKTKREEMKLMQDMSLKKKAWLAEEQRKQELHQQKLKDMKAKSAMAMKQSQE